MKKHNHILKRAGALAISLLLVGTSVDVPGLVLGVQAAQESMVTQTVVTAFEELDAEIAEQTVTVGSSKKDINFPSSIRIGGEGIKSATPSEFSDEGENIGWKSVSVKWEVDPEESSTGEFSSENAGEVFFFVPVLSDKYIVDDEMELPTICVTIVEAENTGASGEAGENAAGAGENSEAGSGGSAAGTGAESGAENGGGGGTDSGRGFSEQTNIGDKVVNTSGGTAGNWNHIGNDWTFTYSDGSQAKSEWVYTSYLGISNWYHFDTDGKMQTGWLTVNGSTYYLNPVSDGRKGRMLTGWVLIAGKWYYFEPVAGKDQGHLYRNQRTPDGFYVGADGAWIP